MSDMPLSEEWRIISKKWVDAENSANMYEEGKSATLARMMVDKGEMAVSKAEMLTKASQDWADYIKAMVEARTAASYLKIQLDYIKMRHSEMMSHEASKRAEMKL